MVTFVVLAALAVGVLIAAPLAAHLLRRGRGEEREFPPAALVPSRSPVARRRSRLDDRLVLAVRVSMIAALAVLGATPLVRCSRLSLGRAAGASIAMALIVDDSLSMRAATPTGESRFAVALEGAHDLLRSAREGDAVAVVLGGRPARLALAATTDLRAARQTLDELEPSDRATDLGGAVQIGRSALEQLPHLDKRVVLLSDLANESLPAGPLPVWAPLPDLAQPMHNCGIVSAERRVRRVSVSVACSSPAAARGRRVQLVPGRPSEVDGQEVDAGPVGAGETPIAESSLMSRSGSQTVTLEAPASAGDLDARLSGSDALARDDVLPVAAEDSALGIAVVVDPTLASVPTGGATPLEQALAALELGAKIRPLTLVPDEASELDPYSALLLDDPAGLPAQARMALTSWIRQGGVAVALLGPRAHGAQLGSSLEPFVSTAVIWNERPEAKGIDPGSIGWLGKESESLVDLRVTGRAELDGAEMPDALVVARWDDGRAFVVERALERGLVIAVGLPVSVGVSDFALRPGFLSLLDHVAARAYERSGPRRSVAGSTWHFAGSEPVSIAGPAGPVLLRESIGPVASGHETGRATRLATAALLGRYVVRLGDEQQVRVVAADPDEITRQPVKLAEAGGQLAGSSTGGQVDASAELALVIAALFFLELCLRMMTRRRRHRYSRSPAR